MVYNANVKIKMLEYVTFIKPRNSHTAVLRYSVKLLHSVKGQGSRTDTILFIGCHNPIVQHFSETTISLKYIPSLTGNGGSERTRVYVPPTTRSYGDVTSV